METIKNVLGSLGCLSLIGLGIFCIVSGYAIHGAVIWIIVVFVGSKLHSAFGPDPTHKPLMELASKVDNSLQEYNKIYPFGALGENSKKEYSPRLNPWKTKNKLLFDKVVARRASLPEKDHKKDKFQRFHTFTSRYESIISDPKAINQEVDSKQTVLPKIQNTVAINKTKPKLIKAKLEVIDQKNQIESRNNTKVEYAVSNQNKVQLKDQKICDRIQEILKSHKVNRLYHFTDRSNIPSIQTAGGLLSYSEIKSRGISIKHFGSSEFSRSRDQQKGLGNFVRLSFTRHHPMMYSVQKDGRMPNPVVLHIDPAVCSWKTTLFADQNAVRNNFNFGGDLSDFEKIRMDVVTQYKHFDLSDEDKPYYQAEVMVQSYIPLSMIMNIEKFR